MLSSPLETWMTVLSMELIVELEIALIATAAPILGPLVAMETCPDPTLISEVSWLETVTAPATADKFEVVPTVVDV